MFLDTGQQKDEFYIDQGQGVRWPMKLISSRG